jgi:hypothetical protein
MAGQLMTFSLFCNRDDVLKIEIILKLAIFQFVEIFVRLVLGYCRTSYMQSACALCGIKAPFAN